MRGFPKWINNEQDIENLKKDFPKELEAYTKSMKETRFTTQSIDLKDYDSKDAEAVPVQDEKGVIISYVKVIEDPNSRYFKLNLDKLEVTK